LFSSTDENTFTTVLKILLKAVSEFLFCCLSCAGILEQLLGTGTE
jgi:hypothetical protein